MDDMNDIRMTLGAVHNAMRDLTKKVEHLTDKVDDYGALAVRSARLTEVIEALEEMTSELPAALRKLGDDPTFGMFLREPLNEIADGLEESLTEWRNRRGSAPRIEQG